MQKIILLFLVSLLSSCLSYDYSRRIIQQGNLLPETNVKQLKIGMSKTTVATILGTSLLAPTFNNERWDYAYSYRIGNHPMKLKNVRLFFRGDKLIAIKEGN